MRVLVYDATQRGSDALWLSTFWSAGRFTGDFDYVIAAESWEDAYRQIEALPDELLEMAEYWMHGRAGAPLIDDEPPELGRLAAAWGSRLRGPHWFRCCDVGQGNRGQRWAALAAKLLRAVVVHTRVVSQAEPPPVGAGLFRKVRGFMADAWSILTGVWYQSGCYGLRDGETPHWPVSDRGYSGRRQPSTVLLTDHRPPPGAWQ